MSRIALMGLSRTGKDTIAQIVQELAVDYHYRLAFGDGVRDELFRLAPHLKNLPKQRKHMNDFGQGMRAIYPDVWVKHLERRMQLVQKFTTLSADVLGDGHDRQSYIITDLRQPNEHEWAIKNGFCIVRVVAPEEDRRKRAVNDAEFISVGEPDKLIDTLWAHHVLINNGSMHGLRTEVKHMMDSLRVERRPI